MSKIKRRIFILLVLTLCTFSIMIFILEPKKFKFYRLGPGFIFLSELKEIKPFPPEALIITTVDDWNSYAKKYLIMIGPPHPFPEDKAVLIISLPSAMDYKKITYGSYTIKNIVKRGSELIVNVNLNKEQVVGNLSEIKSLFYESFLIDLKDVSHETTVRIIKEK